MVAHDPAMRWYRRGAGVPVVLLHGFTGSAASWEAVAGRLTGPVVAMCQPGHHPEVPVADDFVGCIDAMIGTLRQIGVGPARVVGYSLGARCALGIADRAPELVDSLDLIGVHPGLGTAAERDARSESDARFIEMLETLPLARFIEAWSSLPIWRSQARLPDPIRRRQLEIRAGQDPAALAASLRVMGLARMPDYRRVVAARAEHIRLITGELDAKFCSIAAGLARSYPALETHVVPGAGHNVVLEAPAALAEIIARGR